MECIFCKGTMKESLTTDFNDFGSCMVIIKNVPCQTCEQCGETIFIGTVIRQLENITDELKESLTEIAVVQYPNKVA
jgi:YgiT-type zinc finger domain-containing protein